VRRFAVLLAASGLAGLLAGPALAHPFGPPPTAVISARGHSVFIEWAAAADDAIAIGEQIGLFPPGTAEQYWEGPAQVAPPEWKEEELSAAPQLRDYLLDHIRVEQASSACEGTVQPVTNFVRQGARVVHRCPAEVDVVEIQISMLHDVHEAYRTFAVSQGPAQPEQAVFTVGTDRHAWDFTAAPEPDAASAPGGGMVWWPLAVLGALLTVGVLVALGRGRAAES
jgi:hypothetical protein